MIFRITIPAADPAATLERVEGLILTRGDVAGTVAGRLKVEIVTSDPKRVATDLAAELALEADEVAMEVVDRDDATPRAVIARILDGESAPLTDLDRQTFSGAGPDARIAEFGDVDALFLYDPATATVERFAGETSYWATAGDAGWRLR